MQYFAIVEHQKRAAPQAHFAIRGTLPRAAVKQLTAATYAVCGAPKSRASTRAVALPGPVVELLAEHLADNVGDDWAALVFTGDKGGPLHRGKLQSAGALG